MVVKILIFNIHGARYPARDPIDRAGKALFDVFEVSAGEGERLSEWSAKAESVFHACQGDAGIAFPDVVKGYLCLHRCGLSDDQRVVVLGRTGGKYEIASIAPALRSCFLEYRVPKLNRRSHGVFVSEMPIDEEEEEEIHEDASIDGMEDVEKFINEDDESDVTLDEDEVREVLAAAWKQKKTRNVKRETPPRVWETAEIDGDLSNEEIPRGRAETENKVQSMWTCGTLGERMSAKIVARSQRRWERK